MSEVFTEATLNESVFVSDEYLLGSDQAYDSYPCRFATVNLMLESSDFLCTLADHIRKDLGFKPLSAMDEYTDETCDQQGWYDFYVGLNDYNESKVDSCITFIIVNSESEDDESSYVIDLSLEEQKAMYRRLDKECKRRYGKSCENLLDEARKELRS